MGHDTQGASDVRSQTPRRARRRPHLRRRPRRASAPSWPGPTPPQPGAESPAARRRRPPPRSRRPPQPSTRRRGARRERAADAAVTDHTAHPTPVGATATGALERALRPVLPPVGPGTVHEYTIPLTDVTLQIAPGVSYSRVDVRRRRPRPRDPRRARATPCKVTLRNDGAIPHSIDFHAARIAPNKAFKDVEARRELQLRVRGQRLRASSCTTAARRRCSRTSPTACTARSSSTRRGDCRRPTAPTSWSPASGT